MATPPVYIRASYINFVAAGRELTKFLRDVEGSSSLLMRASALRSSNPFCNASVLKEGWVCRVY